MAKKTLQYQEIKSVLLGNVMLTEDGRYMSMTDEDFVMPVGIHDGAGAVLFLGLGRMVRLIDTKRGEEETLEAAFMAMRNIGRGLILQGQPDTVACYLKYIFGRPSVLTFEYVDGQPILTAWTGRGLTGWLSNYRSIRAFKKQLPEDITISTEKPKKPEKPEKAGKPKKEKKKKNKGKNPGDDAQKNPETADDIQEGSETS